MDIAGRRSWRSERKKKESIDSSPESLTEEADVAADEEETDDFGAGGGSLLIRLRKVLLAANVTCAEVPDKLAEICALPATTILKWGLGTLQPQAEDLATISKYYGVDLLWLITGVLSRPQNTPHSFVTGEEFVDLGKRTFESMDGRKLHKVKFHFSEGGVELEFKD